MGVWRTWRVELRATLLVLLSVLVPLIREKRLSDEAKDEKEKVASASGLYTRRPTP